MVGSGSGSSSSSIDRSKEADEMMALHDTLTNVCLNSEWTYSIFWTIRQRPRVRGGNGCKLGDENGSLMLMWEDGFCLEQIENDSIRKAFAKMSIQLYNYGEGLMGKVASDKCHKWVFKEPMDHCEASNNYWQSSFDAIPTEWSEQFESGIQTIAVIQAGHGLLQLGSCKIIAEDLHFVLRMRQTFESLGYQSGFYLSHLFSSTRNMSSPSSSLLQTNSQQSLFNWGSNPIPSPGGLGFHNDESNMLLNLHSSETRDMSGEHGNKFKRSFTLPTRMNLSSMEEIKGGMNQHQADFMDSFLE